jgi:hypothetical protein
MRLAMRERRFAVYTSSKGPENDTPASAASACAAPSSVSSSASAVESPRGHDAKKR